LLGTDFVAQPDRTAAAVTTVDFREELDRVRAEKQAQADVDKKMVGATVAVTGSLSAGYVLWLIRGGVLLSSLLSSLPAWRALDPLPVLGNRRRRKDENEDDDDSLESLVTEPADPPGLSNARKATDPQLSVAEADAPATGEKMAS